MLYKRLSERIRIRQRFNEAMRKLESAIAASYWANKRNLVNSNPVANSYMAIKTNVSFPFKSRVTNNRNIQRRNVSGVSFPNKNTISGGRKVVPLCFGRKFTNSAVNRTNIRTSFAGDKRRTGRKNFCGRKSSAVPFRRSGCMTVNKGVNRGKVTAPFSNSKHLTTRIVAKRSVTASKVTPFSSSRPVTKNRNYAKNSRPPRRISGRNQRVKITNRMVKEKKGKLSITGKSVEVKFYNLAPPGHGFPNQLSQVLHENTEGEEGTAVDLKGVLYLEPHGELTVDNKSYGIEIRNESMNIIYDRAKEEQLANKAEDGTPARRESFGEKGRKHDVKRVKDKAHSQKVRSKNLKSLRCHARKCSLRKLRRKPVKEKAIHKKVSKKNDSRRKSVKVKGNRQSKDKTRKKSGLKRKKKSGEKIKKSSHKVKGSKKVVHKKLKAKSKQKLSKNSKRRVKTGSKRRRKVSAKEAERRALEATGIISVSMVKKEVPENEELEETPLEMFLVREEEKKKGNEAVNETEGEEVVVKKKRVVKSKSDASKKLKTKIKSKLKVKSEEYKKKKRTKPEGHIYSLEQLQSLLPYPKKFSMLTGDNL